MELQEFILVLGNGVLLPWGQKYLNQYIPKQYRAITVFIVSLILGALWTVLYGNGLEALLTNTGMIFTASQTIYFKIIKEKEAK